MAEKKIQELLGMPLPPLPLPVGLYLPAVVSGNLIYTSGQLPMKDGKILATGKFGKEFTEEQAAPLAKQAVINGLCAVKSVIGNLDKIEKIVKLSVFVNSAPGFFNQPKVANYASEFLVQVFGENGKHARVAVGVAELPMNAPLELEMIMQTKL